PLPGPAGDAVPLPGRTPLSECERQDGQAARAERVALSVWWLTRVTLTERPWREKLTMLCHGHFATSIEKVRVAKLMYDQNELFRQLGAAHFEALTLAVAKDPAMLVWLDANTNRSGHPN